MFFVAEIRKRNNSVINDNSVKRENIVRKFNIQSMGKEFIFK